MAYRLGGAKPIPEPMHEYCHLDTWEQNNERIILNSNIFFDEYAFENVVCETLLISSRSQCVQQMHWYIASIWNPLSEATITKYTDVCMGHVPCMNAFRYWIATI